MTKLKLRKVHSTDVIQAVRDIAAENLDYVYRDVYINCEYVNEDATEGRCLIGKALVQCGIDPKRLDIDSEFESMYEDFVIEDHELHVDWIQGAQHAQDSGSAKNSWAKVVAIADLERPEVAREVK